MTKHQMKNCLLCLSLCAILVTCGSAEGSVATYGTRATLEIPSTPMPELVPSEPTVRPLQSVVVVGDSLTVGTEIYGTTLTQSLFNAGVTKVFVSAENGRTTSEGITELERLPIDDGAVILALGTNDVAGGTPEIFGGLIDQAVAIIPKTIDIFWLNLYTDQWVSDDAYNAKINQKANIYSNLFVMDFETFASPNWLEGDGVHLSPEGYIERTEFILTELGLK